MQLLTIQNDFLKVTLADKGAEMQSIIDAKGRERLWQGDPAFWEERAPILFPVAGGLRDDRYTLDGQTYPMPKHGFVRNLTWDLADRGESFAVYRISQKHEGFPFDYCLYARYELKGNAIKVSYTVKNKGDKRFVYSLGSHEGFCTPGGIEKWAVRFERPENLQAYQLEGALLRHDTVSLGENVSLLPLKTEYFLVDALIFLGIKSRRVRLESKRYEGTITVDFPGKENLLLWQKPGANYLCIEPWLNAPDFVDADGDILKKPGCVLLLPGEEKTHTHVITVD